MGTRADFYIGQGKQAEWLGSVAYDGYPQEPREKPGIPRKLLKVKTEKAFRSAVVRLLASRQDGSSPEDGWPWPWKDSGTTDYAYALVDGKVLVCPYGTTWCDPLQQIPDEGRDDKTAVFPDMTAKQQVTLGPRSGLLLFGGAQ